VRSIGDRAVITRELAEEKKLEHGLITRTVIKIMTSGFELGQKTKIDVGGIEEKVTPLLLDIQLLSNVAGKDLLGIVGEEFFERHVVEVDFTRKVLRLHDRRTFIAPADLPVIELKSATTAKTACRRRWQSGQRSRSTWEQPDTGDR
jgi:hypothetical protein